MVDDHPRFHLDALRWFASLTGVTGVHPRDLVVHVVGPEDSEPLAFLSGQGVELRAVDRFDARSPHCNKIAGALDLADQGVDGLAVLCDTDIVVLEDPRRLDLPAGTVAGKLVDAPVPSLETVLTVFSVAGLDAPEVVPLPWGEGDRTVAGNANGGLYLVPGELLPHLAPAWAHWATWLLDRADLLKEWTVYVDQVAMAMALAAERIGTEALEARWNTPIHDPSRIPQDAAAPSIIHYHQQVDQHGLLRATGVEAIDRRIDTANRAIAEVWRRAAPDATGPRSTESAEDPADPTAVADPRPDRGRWIVTELVDMLGPVSIAEVDEQDGAPEPADVVVSLGGLDPRADPSDLETAVDRLWRSARRALVVGGRQGPDPGHALGVALARAAPGSEVYPVAVDGDATVFVALRAPEVAHARDFGPATLLPLVDRHPDPLTLALLRLHARQSTGFYPDHAPRLWEYPVVARLVADHLPAGSRLVDVGAGVTPLAPFLSSRGYLVDTVDPSPTVRTWPPQPDWNEWDYLDYGAAGLAHRSWNCTLDELPTRPQFDGAYSVSVIEHVPAAARRALLGDISVRTRPGGLVVLTIDLERGTDTLWNRSRGLEVEDPRLHGTFGDVVHEGARVGLELIREETVRSWGDTNPDIGLLAMRQTSAPEPVGRRRTGITRFGRLVPPRWRSIPDPTSRSGP